MKKLLFAIAAISALSIPALSQAATPPKFLGEIFAIGGNYCPEDSHLANGKLLDINNNSALFTILGTTYGGDGRSTFALPNLNTKGEESDKPKVTYCVVTNGWFPNRASH